MAGLSSPHGATAEGAVGMRTGVLTLQLLVLLPQARGSAMLCERGDRPAHWVGDSSCGVRVFRAPFLC